MFSNYSLYGFSTGRELSGHSCDVGNDHTVFAFGRISSVLIKLSNKWWYQSVMCVADDVELSTPRLQHNANTDKHPNVLTPRTMVRGAAVGLHHPRLFKVHENTGHEM